MAATITLSGDWLQNVGSCSQTSGTLTLGTYATGGVSVLAKDLGLGSFIGTPQFSADGYVLAYDLSTSKVLAYRSAGFTPAGTISKPTFTVTKGAILASSELGLSADAATATVNNNTIASTLALTTNSPVGTPTLTGTAVAAAALVEVANGVDLAAVVVDFVAYGK